MNVVVLIGNLARDPELKYTQNGKAVCNFTLAVNNPYAENKADFISVTAWDKQAENIAQYLRKGSKAGVEGRLQVRSYEDKDGNRRWVTEVVANRVEFLGGKGGGSTASTSDVPYGEEVPADNAHLPF